MKELTLLIKPAAALCNLSCRYCFYKDLSQHHEKDSMQLMSEDTAETLIRRAFRSISSGGTIQFLFQGGEPTLAGLSFFQNFIRLEKSYAKPDVRVCHSIQTNGLLIDDDWAEFLRDNDFLVGLSVDGTQPIHDYFRSDEHGNGSWHAVLHALKLLEKYHVETNLLCVVTEDVAQHPAEVYRSLTSLGRHPLQFIPCLDEYGKQRGQASYSLSPDSYGHFLKTIFDLWYADWKAGHYISIRSFDDYIRHLLRQPPCSCASSGSCGHYLVVEANGNLYPCDFYVTDEWLLGNIHQTSIPAILKSEQSQAFLSFGSTRPAECTSCRYAPICRGGCRRDFTESGSNYYCSSLQSFFPYAIERLEEMAAFFIS